MSLLLQKNAALLLIDLQNDFCKNGALAVPQGDDVIAIANTLMPHFSTVIATQDWHPNNHTSFESLWPVHCVQESVGAQFHPELNTSSIDFVTQKGMDINIDSYSAFYDNAHLKSTGLTTQLREKKIDILYVMGLATDYCVKFTCLDARKDGFTVCLIEDGCRGVNLQENDVKNALDELQSAGVHFIKSKNIVNIHGSSAR